MLNKDVKIDNSIFFQIFAVQFFRFKLNFKEKSYFVTKLIAVDMPKICYILLEYPDAEF